jgi:hypothetical protein
MHSSSASPARVSWGKLEAHGISDRQIDGDEVVSDPFLERGLEHDAKYLGASYDSNMLTTVALFRRNLDR